MIIARWAAKYQSVCRVDARINYIDYTRYELGAVVVISRDSGDLAYFQSPIIITPGVNIVIMVDASQP